MLIEKNFETTISQIKDFEVGLKIYSHISSSSDGNKG